MNVILRNKKSIFITVGIVIILLIVLTAIFASNKETYADNVVRENLKNFDWSTQIEPDDIVFANSPFAYIRNNENYEEIIKLGVAAIPELEKQLQSSDENGLNEYVIALAISEISGTDVSLITKGESYAWSNAKQFLAEWKAAKELVEIDIVMLLQNDSMANKELRERIQPYGVLAIPVIRNILTDDNVALTPAEKRIYHKELIKIVNESKLLENEIDLLEDSIPDNCIGFEATKNNKR